MDSPYLCMKIHLIKHVIMKKILFAIALASFCGSMSAQSEGLLAKKQIKSSKETSAYEKKGVVPEIDGKVVFKDVISAPGKSKEAIFNSLKQWASLRYEANISRGAYTDTDFFKNIEYAKVKSADNASGTILCDGAEELIFSIKTLAKNYTQAFYTLTLKANDDNVEFRLDNLSFNIDEGEGRFSRVTAEEWITDKESLNKKGKLARIPGKYRVKTVDLVDELKKEISAAL